MDPIVLMGDPSVANIPVDECGEPLEVAGSDFTMSPLMEADDPHRSRLRVGVRERLLAARSHLPAGVRLCWVEGQRDARLQARYFDSYQQQLQELDPTLDAEAAAQRSISPCATRTATSSTWGPVNASPEESDGACYFDARVSNEARAHRTVLARALNEVGLVNYPTEWWHWSYGDRYWALKTGAPAAIYGPLAG